MPRAPGEDLEVDLGMRIGGDDVDGAAPGEIAQGQPAANQRLGAEQPARVDLAVGPAKALWTDGRRLFVRR